MKALIDVTRVGLLPLAHVPRTALPQVRELSAREGLMAWLAAGGRVSLDGRLLS